jgi:mannose-6-phosphate isomerase-like protein (cupin superfamily)
MSNDHSDEYAEPPHLINPVTRDRLWFERIPVDAAEALVFRCEIPAFSPGTPLHIHSRTDERFVCISGLLSMQVGSRCIILSPGGQLDVPRGTLHRFFNASDSPVVFQSTVTPGNDFVKFLESVYGLASDGLVGASGMPKSLLRVAVLRELSDLYFPTVPLFIQRPAFGILSRVARWTGVHASMGKYWHRAAMNRASEIDGRPT